MYLMAKKELTVLGERQSGLQLCLQICRAGVYRREERRKERDLACISNIKIRENQSRELG